MKDIFSRTFSVPGLGSLEKRIQSLSRTGKLVFGILAVIFCTSAIILLAKINNEFLVAIPRPGGTLSEGIVGTPRLINPVLAVTDSDKDLSELIYSGLMRRMPDGTLIPDIASGYTISADGKTYDFKLKPNAIFQNGTPLTADDVIFTIKAIQDPATKSPKEPLWQGVTVTKINDHELTFTLAQPYAPFIENTTIGILPQHLFQTISDSDMENAAVNTHPVGSGPYEVSSINNDSSGVPTAYTLSAFKNFILGTPLISNVVLRFYPSEDDAINAYTSGDVEDISSIPPDTAYALKNMGVPLVEAALPRTFAVFFNQSSNPALADLSVRQALAISVDREYITNTVLRGFGTPLQSAVPQSFALGFNAGTTSTITQSIHAQVDAANALLEKNGWKLNSQGIREKKTAAGTTTLAFSISTSDAPELKQTADILKDEWHAIGADVTVKVVEGGYLNQNIIRPRKYDALLFGQVVNPDLDLVAFWHSSEVSDPGLNVALYSNKTADKLLENMRITLDPLVRQKEYQQFDAQLQKDVPAVFLYSPDFLYVLSPDVKNASISAVTTASDRFGSIYEWYINIDKVWSLFAPHH